MLINAKRLVHPWIVCYHFNALAYVLSRYSSTLRLLGCCLIQFTAATNSRSNAIRASFQFPFIKSYKKTNNVSKNF